jgi:hypothetical protein
MAHTKLLWISHCSIALGLLFGSGCGKDDEPGDEDANDSSGTGNESADDDDSNTVSVTNTDSITTDSADDSGTATVEDSGSTDASSTFEDSGTTEGDPPAPNGSSCSEDADCESMHCYTSALGNICGECVTDEHCADTTMGGCSIPNPLGNPPTGSVCNDGSLGGGCMSTDVCMDGLVCVEILNAAPIIVASTCSECETDADCGDDLCSPGYDVINLSGSKTCVAPGSVVNGEGCDFNTSGNEACFSGFCAVANVMDIVQLGVCSECLEDMDCGPNETCEAPVISLEEGLTAGFCMPA